MEILLSSSISLVIDVRSSPRSKIETFSQAYLRDLLMKEGIAYLFLGAELGGLRKGGYEAYTATEAFHQGIDRLEEAISGRKGVILCAERFPWKCHRKWISRELQRRGWLVEHILDKEKIWIPRNRD
ncbi:MAG: DUF488 domain-containing protein [Thermodesulfovibrionales bacterium]